MPLTLKAASTTTQATTSAAAALALAWRALEGGWPGGRRAAAQQRTLPLAAALVVACVVVEAAFRGRLFRFISRRERFPEIDTFQQLADANLPIFTISMDQVPTPHDAILAETYGGAELAARRRAYGQTRLVPKIYDQERMAVPLWENVWYGRRSNIFLRRRVHIMRDWVERSFSAWHATSNWPWVDTVNLFTLRLTEAGLLDRWREEFAQQQEDLELSAYRISPRTKYRILANYSDSNPAPLLLRDVADYVFILLGALAVAMVVFVGESCCCPPSGSVDADDSSDSEDERQRANPTHGDQRRESHVVHVSPIPSITVSTTEDSRPQGARSRPLVVADSGVRVGNALTASAAGDLRRNSCPGLTDVDVSSTRVGFANARDTSYVPQFRRRSCPEDTTASSRKKDVPLKMGDTPSRLLRRSHERDFTDLYAGNSADPAAIHAIYSGQNSHSRPDGKHFPQDDAVGGVSPRPHHGSNPRIVINSPSSIGMIQPTSNATPGSASLSRSVRATTPLFGSTVSLASIANMQNSLPHISDLNNAISSKTADETDEILQLDVSKLSLFGSQVSLPSTASAMCVQDQRMCVDVDSSNVTMCPVSEHTILQSTNAELNSDIATMSVFGSNGSLALVGDTQCVVGRIPSLGIASVSATSVYMATVPFGGVSNLKHPDKCDTIFHPAATEHVLQQKSKSTEATDVVSEAAMSTPASNVELGTSSRRNSDTKRRRSCF